MDSILSVFIFTEGIFNIEHEVEENPEGPHVNFVSIFISLVYFRGHKLFSAKDGASNVSLLFAEAKIGQFEHLHQRRVTSFPFYCFTSTFWDLMSLWRYCY